MILKAVDLWLDTESNGFHGPLIAMGIVGRNGERFYATLPVIRPTPWVVENVLPVMGDVTHQGPAGSGRRSGGLAAPVQRRPPIADWHRDFVHFLELMGLDAGKQMLTPPISMSLKTWLRQKSVVSAVPHHPLEDAIALMSADGDD